MNDWQPIESYDGREGLEVLGASSKSQWSGAMTYFEGHGWYDTDPGDPYGTQLHPTHWMLMPAAPAAEGAV